MWLRIARFTDIFLANQNSISYIGESFVVSTSNHVRGRPLTRTKEQQQLFKFVEDFYSAFGHGDSNAEAEKQPEAANVRLLQKHFRYLFDGLEAGDFGPFAASMAEDITYSCNVSGDHPFGGSLCGRDIVLEHVKANFEMVRDQMPEVTSVIAQGNQVVLAFRETGWFLPADVKYDSEIVQIFTFRDGLVAEFQMFGPLPPINSVP